MSEIHYNIATLHHRNITQTEPTNTKRNRIFLLQNLELSIDQDTAGSFADV
jgi:hypothetical protein